MEKRMNNRVVKSFTRAFKHYAPPLDLTVSEWAERYRVLSRESSAEAGRWRNQRTPYLVDIMDAFNDARVHKVSVVAGSQIGKTEALLNILGYIIDQDPGGVLFVQPTVEDSKKFSKFRISPMLRDSKALKGKVEDGKSRDGSNTILQKAFPGGNLIMVGSNAPSGLASNPMRYILGDEIDRWALSAGDEGDPYTLAERRTQTFYNHKIFTVSTPTIKGASKIEKLFNSGTQERYCYRCPNCGEYHNITFNDIKFDFETTKKNRIKEYSITSLHYRCPDCGFLFSENEIKKQPAKWIAENPEAVERGERSFWLSGFSSPWNDWGKIVLEFLQAKDDPKRLQVFYNTTLGELWEDRGNLADDEALLERREDYGQDESGKPIELPEGVLVLTCGVDTQDDMFSYEVVGHGRFEETWGIKYGRIYGDPHDAETWAALDEVIDHVHKFRDGKGLKISYTFVDSGGHKTQDVYRECSKRIHKRVFAVKGQGGDGIPYTKPPSKVKIVVNGRVIGTAYLYALGVDSGKADIMSNVKVQEPGPKYCHFPLGKDRGYDRTYFSELLSEKLVQKTEKGRTRWAWEQLPGHPHNEALDVRNYALAAFRAFDPDLDAVENRLRGIAQKQEKAEMPKKSRVKKNKIVTGEW